MKHFLFHFFVDWRKGKKKKSKQKLEFPRDNRKIPQVVGFFFFKNSLIEL